MMHSPIHIKSTAQSSASTLVFEVYLLSVIVYHHFVSVIWFFFHIFPDWLLGCVVNLRYYKKSFLKCCLSNVEDGMWDDILWDDSESSHENASALECDSESEETFEEHFDQVKKQEERLF